MKKEKTKNWENNIFEYNGEWHKKGKDGNCEPFIMADLRELLAQEKQEWAEEIKKYQDALIWCSGSDDFQLEGKARKGWEKICKPLLVHKLKR